MALKVGLIGTGFMGKCHALAWNAVGPTFAVERPRLLHLAENDADRCRTATAAFGFERSSTDWHDVVRDPDVDIVSITTPNPLHAEIAIAALQAGKHVWCEKPMATGLEDARRMAEVWRGSGRVAVLGYNYIQSPALRAIDGLLRADAIGPVNHVRLEMDEDFMADGQAPFAYKNTAQSGYGALDDFAVHPLSILTVLGLMPDQVMLDMSRPVTERPASDGTPRPVENHDISTALLRIGGTASGLLVANRAAWGRKGRLQLQVFGARGAIVFDQERFNEFQVYTVDGESGRQGFRTVIVGPDHEPYGSFVPAPGHSLGFNDLKTIEAHEILKAIAGRPARVIDFAAGLQIETTVDAMARSFQDGAWKDVPQVKV